MIISSMPSKKNAQTPWSHLAQLSIKLFPPQLSPSAGDGLWWKTLRPAVDPCRPLRRQWASSFFLKLHNWFGRKKTMQVSFVTGGESWMKCCQLILAALTRRNVDSSWKATTYRAEFGTSPTVIQFAIGVEQSERLGVLSIRPARWPTTAASS